MTRLLHPCSPISPPLDFRNLEPLKWGPGPGTHLLLGGNGAGKTSLLEAVYVARHHPQLPRRPPEDCVRHGAGGFQARREVETDHRSDLEVRWIEGKRLRLLNGKAAPLAEHLAALPIVAWTYAEAEVLVGAPKARRRFLDRGLVGIRPAALDLLNRYREALRQKRELLLRDGPGIEVWNELLATTAAEVIRLRHAYVERLRELGRRPRRDPGSIPADRDPLPPLAGGGARRRGGHRRGLERAADRERARQIPLLGPQRDELEILWGGHDIRRVASAGERKALSLLLLAAHGRVLETAGRPPSISSTTPTPSSRHPPRRGLERLPKVHQSSPPRTGRRSGSRWRWKGLGDGEGEDEAAGVKAPERFASFSFSEPSGV